MNTNALRCQIIARILQMDRTALGCLRSQMDDLRRSTLPADLPEWMTSTQAADFLNLTPRHTRRLAHESLPGLNTWRQSGQQIEINRDLLRSIADAPAQSRNAP